MRESESRAVHPPTLGARGAWLVLPHVKRYRYPRTATPRSLTFVCSSQRSRALLSCRPASAWRLVPTPSLPVASSLVVLVLNSLHSWLLLALSVVVSFPLCACSGDEVGERWGIGAVGTKPY